MKYYLILACLLQISVSAQSKLKTDHIVIITIDGVRWQELFNGADSVLINNVHYTADTSLAKLEFWDQSPLERRKKLTPFFWNIIDKKGQIYGNRDYKNKVRVANFYKFSYPGYNEILTGYPDQAVNSNKPVENNNVNILEFLNNIPVYKDSIVAFTSWNVFPFILGTERNKLPVYSGYTSLPDSVTNTSINMINRLQEIIKSNKKDTRYDQLTFLAATEYIQQHAPKVIFISLGEPDESAHKGEYDKYLQQINNADRMISQLWYFIQSNSTYKNKTTLLITTDHGRGEKNSTWTKHDTFIKGSGNAWIGIMGPDINPDGEMKQHQKLYEEQIANSVASLLGLQFITNHHVAKAINFNSAGN